MSETPKSKCERCRNANEGHPLPNIAIFLNPSNDLFPGTRPRRPTNEHQEAYTGAYRTVITIENQRVTIENEGHAGYENHAGNEDLAGNEDHAGNENHDRYEYHADNENQAGNENHAGYEHQGGNERQEVDDHVRVEDQDEDDEYDDWNPRITEEMREETREKWRKYLEDPDRIRYQNMAEVRRAQALRRREYNLLKAEFDPDPEPEPETEN